MTDTLKTSKDSLAEMRKEMEEMRGAIALIDGENKKLLKENENMSKEMSHLRRRLKTTNHNLDNVKQSISTLPQSSSYKQKELDYGQGREYESKETLEIETGIIDSLSRPKRQRRGSVKDLFSLNGTNYIYNTKTIHMYAVTITCFTAARSTKWGVAKSWFLTFVSLSVLLAQIFVVESLLYEAAHPTCATHNDCRAGEFCNYISEFSESRQPRCSTCSEIMSDELKQKCLSDSIVQSWDFNGFGKDVLWFHQDFSPSYDLTYLNLGYNISEADQDFYLLCAAAKHCSSSSNLAGVEEIPASMCPYLELMMAQVSVNHIIVFAFVAALFGATLTEDMREATIENALLDYTLQNLPDSSSIPLSVFGIRLSNLIRKYYLPSMTAGATVSILLSGALSAKNILLNLLAVLFVTEADNHLATLFIPCSEHELSDRLIDMANKSKLTYSGSESRLLGVILSGMILTVTVCFRSLIVYISPNEGCSSIDNVLQGIFLFFVPIVIFAAKAFIGGAVCLYGSNEKLANLLKLSRMWTAFIVSIFFCGLSILSLFPRVWEVVPVAPLIFNLISSTCASARIDQVQKTSMTFSPLNYTLNIVIILFWVAIQIWWWSAIYHTFT